ncbi:MAG: hypothetical protein IT437_12350 [Phycisphaerales bacterium]|nr:hypothetical protein [Phycisphaerales bacterium]
MRTKPVLFVAAAACLSLGLGGCMTPPHPQITAGSVKQKIQKGFTTEADVLEAFGPPDQVTHRDDVQIWTYERIVQEREFSGGYVNVLAAGSRTTRERSASTSTMLIIYFDDDDTVMDYRLHKASY